MKVIDLINVIRDGHQPVIIFNSNVDDIGIWPDAGMMGRIVKIGCIEDDGEDEYVSFFIDTESYREYNEKIMGESYDEYEYGDLFELYEVIKSGKDNREPYFFTICDNLLVDKYFEVKERYATYIEFLEDNTRKQLEITTKRTNGI